MAFPGSSDYPGSLDTPYGNNVSRVDGTHLVYQFDFNYPDRQIRRLQEAIGLTNELIGARIAAHGHGGMVSAVADSGVAFKFVARDAFTSGDLFSIGDDYDSSPPAYTEKFVIDADGRVWSADGFDADNALLIPSIAGPSSSEARRLVWDSTNLILKYDDGANMLSIGLSVIMAEWATAYSYTLAATPIEEVLGQGVMDGDLVGSLTSYFRAVVTPVFAAAGSLKVRLWDLGPKAGPPASPRLVCEISTTTTSGPQALEEALIVVSGGVASNDNKILDTPRMYELTALMSGTLADTAYIGSAGLEVR